MSTTKIHLYIGAPRDVVYKLLVDARAVAKWKVPDGMTIEVHEFDAREGGTLRISLTYDDLSKSGKTTARTDTYAGRFVKLVLNEQVIEVDEFDTSDPALRGEMTISITLADAGVGTLLTAVHDGLPPGVSQADNKLGWELALAKLAALAESE